MDRIILGESIPYQWFGIRLLVPKDWRAHYTREEIEAKPVHVQHFYAGAYEQLSFLMLVHQTGHFNQMQDHIQDYIDGVIGMVNNAQMGDVLRTTVGGHDAFSFNMTGEIGGVRASFAQIVFTGNAGELYTIAMAGDKLYCEGLELIVSSVVIEPRSGR